MEEMYKKITVGVENGYNCTVERVYSEAVFLWDSDKLVIRNSTDEMIVPVGKIVFMIAEGRQEIS